MDHTEIEKHSLLQSITLHLLPGILITVFYFLLRQTVINWGYPAIFALVLAIIFILIPFELGYLLFQGKKMTGQYTLKGLISYRNPVPWWQCIIWVLFVFGLTGAILVGILKPVTVWLQDKLFFWMPGLDNGLDGNYTQTKLIITYSLSFVFVTILGPLVEELYFRGYLLPRIKGRFAPVIHSFLFALYHFFTPWMVVARTLGFLPMIYSVRKKSIYIGIFVHILSNSVDVITAVLFIMNMS